MDVETARLNGADSQDETVESSTEQTETPEEKEAPSNSESSIDKAASRGQEVAGSLFNKVGEKARALYDKAKAVPGRIGAFIKRIGFVGVGAVSMGVEAANNTYNQVDRKVGEVTKSASDTFVNMSGEIVTQVQKGADAIGAGVNYVYEGAKNSVESVTNKYKETKENIKTGFEDWVDSRNNKKAERYFRQMSEDLGLEDHPAFVKEMNARKSEVAAAILRKQEQASQQV